jgi:hypothetical protein
MDAVYLFRHSTRADEEIRFSLRSIARNMPYLRKVWIFGDRPRFISEDTNLIECVPWETVAWIIRARLPVRNFFLQCSLAAMHPEVDHEFFVFCDDFIVLERAPQQMLRAIRYVEDMSRVKSRGVGAWKEQLWRTYELLKRFGYGSINYESHTPYFFTKKQVFEAYRDLCDFVTEDIRYGMTGPTAIYNHAHKRQRFPVINRGEEGLYAGFHGKPASYDEVVKACKSRLFLNFDDDGYGVDVHRYLCERFPEACCYERPGSQPFIPQPVTTVAHSAVDHPTGPAAKPSAVVAQMTAPQELLDAKSMRPAEEAVALKAEERPAAQEDPVERAGVVTISLNSNHSPSAEAGEALEQANDGDRNSQPNAHASSEGSSDVRRMIPRLEDQVRFATSFDDTEMQLVDNCDCRQVVAAGAL